MTNPDSNSLRPMPSTAPFLPPPRLPCHNHAPVKENEIQEAEKESMAKLHEQWTTAKTRFVPPFSDDENRRFDDHELLRHLRGRDGDLDEALKSVVRTALFRRKLVDTETYLKGIVNSYPAADSKTELSSVLNGGIYRRGFDSQNHPIIVIKPCQANPSQSSDDILLDLTHALDTAVLTMPEGIDQVCIIIDYGGSTKGNQLPIASVQAIFDVMSRHYPERVFAVFVTNASWFLKIGWNVVQAFVPPKTKKKVNFVESGADEASLKTIREIIPKEYLDVELGGNVVPSEFDYESYWNEELADYKRYKDSIP